MNAKRRLATFAAATLALNLIATGASAVTLTAYYNFEGVGADRFADPAGAFADNLVGQFNPMIANDTPGVWAGTQSAQFAGNTVLYTDAFTTDLGPDPDAYTIMFWIKARDNEQENNNTRLMSTRRLPNNAAGPNSWQVEGFGNNGTQGDAMDVRMNVGSSGNWFSPDATNALARSDQGETEAQWRHVTYVLSNSGGAGGHAFGRTFVDGLQTGLALQGGAGFLYDGVNIANTQGQLIIGGDTETAGGRAFTGFLDDIALFAGIVSDEDILAIAQGRMSPADFLPQSAATVPEPASLSLLAIGALAVMRRRQRCV